MVIWTTAVGVSWRIDGNGVETICVRFPGRAVPQSHSETPITNSKKERYTIASFIAANFSNTIETRIPSGNGIHHVVVSSKSWVLFRG